MFPNIASCSLELSYFAIGRNYLGAFSLVFEFSKQKDHHRGFRPEVEVSDSSPTSQTLPGCLYNGGFGPKEAFLSLSRAPKASP